MNEALQKQQEEIQEHGREIREKTAKHWSTVMFENVIMMRACTVAMYGGDPKLMEAIDRTVEQIWELAVRAMVNDWKDPEEDK